MSYKNVQYEAGKFKTNEGGGGGGSVEDVTVDGVSVVNAQGVAEIPAIPDDIGLSIVDGKICQTFGTV